MTATRIILVGEGSSEPTSAFETVRQHFGNQRLEFVFGVRRASEGLGGLRDDDMCVSTNFPGRGLADLEYKLRVCRATAYAAERLLATGRLRPDAMVAVASPPDSRGIRSLGTANGPLQRAIDASPLLFVEEYPGLDLIPGAATIPAGKPTVVVPHRQIGHVPLSREPDEVDRACARNVARLIPDNCTLQLGVGGIAEALADELADRRGLRICSGAVGNTALKLADAGALSPSGPILGSALVGDEQVIRRFAETGRVRLLSSAQVHNPRWLSAIPRLFAINGAVSVDLQGNVNAERIGTRFISGRGGAPDFAAGASSSAGGHSIVALRSDRPGCLVPVVSEASIHGRFVTHIVTEQGVADLRDVWGTNRADRIRAVF